MHLRAANNGEGGGVETSTLRKIEEVMRAHTRVAEPDPRTIRAQTSKQKLVLQVALVRQGHIRSYKFGFALLPYAERM